MAYIALVTLDIVAVDKQRQDFYNELKKLNWKKIPNLTTAWEVKKETADKIFAISDTENQIQQGKEKANIQTKMEYAIQISEDPLITGTT